MLGAAWEWRSGLSHILSNVSVQKETQRWMYLCLPLGQVTRPFQSRMCGTPPAYRGLLQEVHGKRRVQNWNAQKWKCQHPLWRASSSFLLTVWEAAGDSSSFLLTHSPGASGWQIQHLSFYPFPLEMQMQLLASRGPALLLWTLGKRTTR